MDQGIILAALIVQAAPATAEDVEIVITGRGLDEAPGDRVYDIVTLGRERLDSSPSNRLEEVLRQVPGFQQFRRSDSRSANPTSQGATLRALGGNASSRALLILDGVPQTDPFGGWISWPAFDPRRLERIRVVRGGGTGAHGPGALAGTIELESRPTGGSSSADAALAYGSRDSVDLFAGASLPLGSGELSLSGSWARGDGFIPVVEADRGIADRPAPYEQASLAIRAVAPIGGSTELQANLSAFTDSRERGTAFSAIETRGADSSLRIVGRGALPFSALAYVQLRDFANAFASLNADRSDATQVLDQYSVPSLAVGARAEARPEFGALDLRLGGDVRLTDGRTREYYQFSNGEPNRGRVAGGRTVTAGLFAEGSWDWGPWVATAGVRIDHWRLSEGRLQERLLATGASVTDTAFGDRTGWEPTGRAGIAWTGSARLTLRSAAYLGWRLPTLNELYRPFRVGPDATAANASLSPERLQGIEAGADFRPVEQARIGVTVFANRLERAIANVTLGQGPGQFPGVGFVAGEYRQRQNLDAVVSRGIEIDAEWAIGEWGLAGGYSFARSEVEARDVAFALDGLRPAQAPRHSASATLSWRRGNVSAAMDVRYVGLQYEDDLNLVRIPDSFTIGAVASIPLTSSLALEARAENLLDEEVVSAISGSGIVERATPRTLWLGLRWRG